MRTIGRKSLFIDQLEPKRTVANASTNKISESPSEKEEDLQAQKQKELVEI